MSPMLMRVVVHISLVLLLVVSSEAFFKRSTVHIEVTNRLSNYNDLILHCYEREGEDLGVKILLPLEKFEFSFKPRMGFKSSKYYCSAKWDGSDIKWFDLWSKGRDGREGLQIKWDVTNNKACRFAQDTGTYSVCVVWN
ncbi:S-protein homolog 4-like [Vicia villosa]|uniref:S-protein homolog 4-like n=1 Tax=Vicia villosa TaxID=3911 RepID=UPI00273CE2CA|nr:S-protein homolog 4-like [Vicia villosa]